MGHRGDIVDVSGGFARNFLLPQGRAMVATTGIESQAASMRRRRDTREAADRQSAEAQATVLAGAVVMVPARAGSAGRLFGSVGPAEVADAVRAQKGVELDRRHVVLADPIKTVGTFDVPVDLFPGVTTILSVEVVGAD